MNRYFFVLLTVAVLAGRAAAGPLAPPSGTIAPTMKTLTEVEPRIAVNATNTPSGPFAAFNITQPGSYYLTGNINGVASKDCIRIAADNVTLDLNGFAVIGVAGSGAGVKVENGLGCTLKNGMIHGFDTGVYSVRNASSFEALTILGCAHNGISSGSESRFISCVARDNGEDGLWCGDAALVTGCIATGNAGYGIRLGHSGHAVDCTAEGNNVGIYAFTTGIVEHCVCKANSADGVLAGTESTVRGCTLVYNGDDGVQAADSCVIVGNTCTSNGPLALGAGVYVVGVRCRVEENQLMANHYGILVPPASSSNFIVKNTAGSNSLNFSVSSGNHFAPVISNAGTTFTGATPWSNFTY